MKRLIIAIPLILLALTALAQVQYRVDSGTVVTEQEFVSRDTLQDGLVFYSPLTTAGYIDSTFVDFSHEGNDGTNVALGGVRAAVGQDSTEFNGTNDDINIGDVGALNLLSSDDFTLSIQVKPDAADEAGHVMTKYNNTNGWSLYWRNDSTIGLYADGNNINMISSAVFGGTDWIHAAITVSDSVRFYRNGLFVSNYAVETITSPGGMDAKIGNRGGGTTEGAYFAGDLKSARIYSRALSTSEITTLYTSESDIIVGSPRGDLVVRADSTNKTIELRSTGEIVANEFVEKGTYSSPVAWYPLGHSSRQGAATGDFSVNANDGALTSVTYGTDRDGNTNEAMSFDGAASEVVIADDPAFDITETLTVMCWAKNDNADLAATEVIVSKLSAAVGREWSLYITSDEEVGISFGDPADGSLEGAWRTDDAITVNAWHQIGFTFNRGTVIIYIDGHAIASALVSGAMPASLYNGAADVVISNYDGGALFWEGLIDDVLIFNREFSATEVLTYYNQQKP